MSNAREARKLEREFVLNTCERKQIGILQKVYGLAVIAGILIAPLLVQSAQNSTTVDSKKLKFSGVLLIDNSTYLNILLR